ncbi:hypothetical protein V6B08_17600 [Ferrovibrio sp. MS7]|uniref:hypothetical protein n=1 Tax=Ferrovibrio plantarum TaxID=3119164 RepID=UPI0031376864
MLLFGLASSGCTPLLPLVSAALGGLDGGGGKSMARGPFAGAPSATQNSRPAEPSVNDALAGLDQRIKASCQALLPPPEVEPAIGCVMRDMCLPGGERPFRMRVCAAVGSDTIAVSPVTRMPDWHWANDSALALAAEP